MQKQIFLSFRVVQFFFQGGTPMSNHYSDPTASAAIGSIDREIRRMAKKADRIRDRRKAGRLTPAELTAARREFHGIFRPLLIRALAD